MGLFSYNSKHLYSNFSFLFFSQDLFRAFMPSRTATLYEHFGCNFKYTNSKSLLKSMWRLWGRIDVCTGCWWGSLRERGLWGDQYVYGRIILRWIVRKWGVGVVGTGWSWFRIGTGGGHLWVRCGTFGLHKCGELLD
jgi:hypothetical protein